MPKKIKILQIAKKYFAKNGYENTSLDKIAKEINITKPAVYYYFKSKKKLYNEIFILSFSKLNIDNVTSIKEYIFTLAEFFEQDKDIAKLFSMELSSEANNLDMKTLQTISKTIRKLTQLVSDKDVNPIFLQTVIMSTLTTYSNTLNLRNKVSNIVSIQQNITSIEENLYQMINCYLKGENR